MASESIAIPMRPLASWAIDSEAIRAQGIIVNYLTNKNCMQVTNFIVNCLGRLGPVLILTVTWHFISTSLVTFFNPGLVFGLTSCV